jgi:tRNA-dihydrouridine synthase B
MAPLSSFPTPGFQFADVAVATRALMAPMVGYNEAPLRRICRRFGSGLAVTEMIKPEKLLRGDRQVLRDLAFGDDERPLGAQLAVREPDSLVPAIEQLAALSYDFIDLNLGCPLRKECGKGWGAALLQRPEDVARLVAAAVGASELPVSVKLRAGYQLGELLAPSIAQIAVDAGAALVCVHGRTKMGWYKEPNDPSAIAAVVEAVDGAVPVIGNGDIRSLDDALALFSTTGCDAVMIGRGAMGNPWLFREIVTFLATGERVAPPSFDAVRALYREHMRDLELVFGKRAGFAQIRRYAFHYFGRFGLDNSARAAIAKAKTREDLMARVDELASPTA